MKYFFMGICILLSINFVNAQTIESVLKHSKYIYENANYYIDSGKVVNKVYEHEPSYENALYFKTAYTKSGKFMFEYYVSGSSNSLFTIVRDSTLNTKAWWGVSNQIYADKTLDVMLSTARGVSSMSSTIIPELFYPENSILGNSIFEEFSNAKFLEEETLNGEQCFQIMQDGENKNTVILCISKTTFLIKKIIFDRKVTNFRVKSIYTFDSRIPTNIDNSEFEFRPYRKVKL